MEDALRGVVTLAFGTEITRAFELISIFGWSFAQAGFQLAPFQDDPGIRVQQLAIIRAVFLSIGFFSRKKAIIKTYFRIDSMFGGDPVNGSFDLAAGGRSSPFGVRINAGPQLDHIPRLILDDRLAFENVSVA